jgi:ATP-dependent DNA ligase
MNFDYTNLLRPKDYNGKAPVRWIQDKADGIRILLRKLRHTGRVDAFTRNGLTDFAPLLAAIEPIRQRIEKLPWDTALDCELHLPGDFASNVITHAKAANPNLLLTPFAMPWCGGLDCRSSDMEWVLMQLHDMGWEPVRTHSLVVTDDHTGPIVLSEQSVAELKRDATAEKLEGYIVKLAHYASWWKIKPAKTIDALVTGYKISDSDSFDGGLKAIIVSLWDGQDWREVASVGSGFEAEFRMSCEPGKLVGRVCEVSFDSLAGQGKLKFPRFERWRDDKSPKECTMEQIQCG